MLLELNGSSRRQNIRSWRQNRELEYLNKEHKNVNIRHGRNIQKLWNIMKRPNLQIIGVGEGEETKVNSIDQVFSKIIEDFPGLRKDTPIQIQEVHRRSNRIKKGNFQGLS